VALYKGRGDALKAAAETGFSTLGNSFFDLGSLGATAISNPLLWARGFANEEDSEEFARLNQERRSQLPELDVTPRTKEIQKVFTEPAKEVAKEGWDWFSDNSPNAAETIEGYFSDPRVQHTLQSSIFAAPTAARLGKAFRGADIKKNLTDTPNMNKEAGVINLLSGEGIDTKPMTTASTRIPSEAVQAKQGIDAHSRGDLLVSSALLTPEKRSQLADIYREYPALRNIDPDPEGALEQATDFMAGNLSFVMDRIPTKWREKGQEWYEGYNRIAQDAGKRHNATPEQSASVIAVLSPQTEWNMNLSRADRIMDTYNTRQDFAWSPEMESIMPKLTESIKTKKYAEKLPNIRGKTLGQLDDPAEKAMWIRAYDEAHNPRQFYVYEPSGKRSGMATTKGGQPKQANWASMSPIEKAVRILDDGSMPNISRQLGGQHKVRSFFRNAADPFEETTTTMDTHAIATALMQPLGSSATEVGQNFGAKMSDALTGMRGTYPINQDAYNKVAQALGVEGRQIQSPTWDFGRLLFDKQKTDNKKRYAIEVWEDFSDGRLSQQQALEKIIDAFGMPESPY
jgi:hypothetical protein